VAGLKNYGRRSESQLPLEAERRNAHQLIRSHRRGDTRSYLDYSMSVIIGRALPDARDGLKPVHRRVLYTLSEMGLEHNKKYAKCAKVVGQAMGVYHPHGDSASTTPWCAWRSRLRCATRLWMGRETSARGRRSAGCDALHRVPLDADCRRDAGRHRDGDGDFTPNYDESTLSRRCCRRAFPI